MNFLLNELYQKKKKKKEGKKERKTFIRQIYTIMNSFISFSWFMEQHSTHDIKVTVNKGDTMEMKSKLDLGTILLINYMIEENLFVYAEWFLQNM